MVTKKRVLWIGDGGVATGFARATHHTLEVLKELYEVHVLAVNYHGDPPQKDTPCVGFHFDIRLDRYVWDYPMYPAHLGGDNLGMGRIENLHRALKFDLIVIQTDVWFIPDYLAAVRKADPAVPVVGAIAVDGKNCQGQMLNGLSMAIFWTAFAETEARKGGYTGPSAVVPLGVDLERYTPLDRTECRQRLQIVGEMLGPNDFLVMNLNRNQVRKRFDLLAEYFCEWLTVSGIQDAYLMVHTCPTGENEFDVPQLFAYYGHPTKLFMIEPNLAGLREEALPILYGAADVYASTSQGEGMGLPAMEAMAGARACILGDWAAYGDWAKGAAMLVPCSTTAATLGRVNVLGGIPDKAYFIKALDTLYRDRHVRDHVASLGQARVSEPQYRWHNIGYAFADAMDAIPKATYPVKKAGPIGVVTRA